jgi:hypothetical protein
VNGNLFAFAAVEIHREIRCGEVQRLQVVQVLGLVAGEFSDCERIASQVAVPTEEE